MRLPLSISFKLVAAWDEVEEKLCKRLSMWKKTIYFRKRGKICFDPEHII